MKDLATGLALVLVIEGILWSLFPDMMKRAVVQAAALDGARLRLGGLIFAGLGVALVWLIRR